MKCLQKYQWVKLPRKCLPQGKGILSAWARLASRAAFRKGVASYCSYKNPVEPGNIGQFIRVAHVKAEQVNIGRELRTDLHIT